MVFVIQLTNEFIILATNYLVLKVTSLSLLHPDLVFVLGLKDGGIRSVNFNSHSITPDLITPYPVTVVSIRVCHHTMHYRCTGH